MFADSDQQREKCSRIRTKNGARKRAPDSTPKTAKNVRGFGRKTTPKSRKKGPEKGREKSRGNLRGNLRGNFLAQIPLFSHVFGPQIFTFGIFLRRNLGPKNRFSRPFSGAVFPPFFFRVFAPFGVSCEWHSRRNLGQFSSPIRSRFHALFGDLQTSLGRGPPHPAGHTEVEHWERPSESETGREREREGGGEGL